MGLMPPVLKLSVSRLLMGVRYFLPFLYNLRSASNSLCSQSGRELLTFLLLFLLPHPECCDYGRMRHIRFTVLGIELRALCLLDTHSTS